MSTASPSTKVRTALVVTAHPADGPSAMSQVGENPNLEERMRPFFAAVASEYGHPDGHLAEEFQVVDTS